MNITQSKCNNISRTIYSVYLHMQNHIGWMMMSVFKKYKRFLQYSKSKRIGVTLISLMVKIH